MEDVHRFKARDKENKAERTTPEATTGDFVKVPRWILDQLLSPKLTGAELRVLLVLVEQTFGWRKPLVEASYQDIADRANLSKSGARSAVLSLERAMVITRKPGRYKACIYGWSYESAQTALAKLARRNFLAGWQLKAGIDATDALRKVRACETLQQEEELLKTLGDVR